MTEQTKLPLDESKRRHHLVVIRRPTRCIVCGRPLHAGTEAVLLSFGHAHHACSGEFGAMGGR